MRVRRRSRVEGRPTRGGSGDGLVSNGRTSYFYTAKIAPLGRPFRMPGDEGVPMFLDASSFEFERQRPWHVPVLLAHDRGKKIGMLSDLRPGSEWWHAEFMLDSELSSLLEVGQPVSVGISTMRASGNHYLSELSIVPRGAVRGAEVIGRRELPRPAPRPPVSPAELEVRLRRLGVDVKPGAFAPPRTAPAARAPIVRRRPVNGEWWETDAGQTAELRRRLEATDYADFEGVLEQVRDEIHFATYGVPRRLVA